MTNPTAAMIVIGDEILSGRTRDSNLHYLAKQLTMVGIDLKEVRIVSDETADIVAAVNAMRSKYDNVFTSGGIGPTHDDITADSVADAFNVSIDVRDDARAILSTHYENPEKDLTEARLRMARIPDGAILIENPISKAPGFSIENVHVMAGVPAVFESMLNGLLPKLGTGTPILSRTIAMTKKEGDIAKPLGEIAKSNRDVSIGSYPFYKDGSYGCNVVIRSTDQNRLDDVTRAVEAALLD